MIPLYSDNDFKIAKYDDKLPLKCYQCHQTFFFIKKNILQEIRENRGRLKFCNQKCHHDYNMPTLRKEVNCKQCDKIFIKKNHEIIKTKNNFCSKSCAAIYNNAHKTKGTTVSKLEK